MINQNQRNQGKEGQGAPKPDQKRQNQQNQQSNSRRLQSASSDPQHMDAEDEERKVLRRLDRQPAEGGK